MRIILGLLMGVAFSQATTKNISISGFAFSPDTMTVQMGDTVIWTNLDGFTHTVTNTGSDAWSATLNNGEMFTHIFDTLGTFNYSCMIHISMTGSVTVQSSAKVLKPALSNKFSLRQSSDHLILNLSGFSSRNAKAEICSLKGSVLRAFMISAQANSTVLSTESLPNGLAVFRLKVHDQPVQNQAFMLR